MRHHAANWPSKRERQAGDRPGHTGLGESLIWDRDDMPSLQHPLSRALELCFREEGLNVETDCNSKAKCDRDEGGQMDIEDKKIPAPFFSLFKTVSFRNTEKKGKLTPLQLRHQTVTLKRRMFTLK